MTAMQLSAAAGVLLSLALSYVPGVKPKFEQLSSDGKRLVVLICLVVIAGGSFALSCSGVSVPGLTLACTQLSAADLIAAFIGALVASQGMYLATPTGNRPAA